MTTASLTAGPRETRASAQKASALATLTAASAHQFTVPVVRETPLVAAEPAWVAAMW